LIGKGIFTRPEFVSLLDQNEGPIVPEIFLSPLIENLGSKGIITDEERRELQTTAPRSEATGDETPMDDDRKMPS
jgi:hypothetical protein